MRSCDALVFGENEGGRHFLEYLLSTEGFKVESSSLLSQIIPHCINRRYKLVLLTMGSDGSRTPAEALEKLRVIREIDPALPVVVVSEEVSLDLERKIRGEGIFYFLAQPFSSRELVEVVRCAVRKNDQGEGSEDAKAQ